MAVDKAIEHSAGEQTATNLPCVLMATRTLAWEGSNERKFSYSRRYPYVFSDDNATAGDERKQRRRVWLARSTFTRSIRIRETSI